MSVAKKISDYISEQDYLDGEQISEVKHEYMDGCVYAMAGASKNHNFISGNVLSDFKNQLKQRKSPCQVFITDIKVRNNIHNTQYFYPDVVVTCDTSQDNNNYYTNSPVIIVEVVSESTRIKDKTTKKLAYFNIPTLQEYVLIEQDYCEVEVFRRDNNWKPILYCLGDVITFAAIGVTVSVEDIYYQVDNEEMVNFLTAKEQPALNR